MKKMSIRKDDMVVVLSGKDKGKQGKILEVMPKEGKVVVEKINVVSRHTKPRKQGDQGGILKKEAPIYACKVQRVCPKCGKPTRAAHKVQADGKITQLLGEQFVSNGVKGYNSTAINVAYMGGIDERGKATDNRTDAQKDSLRKLLKLLKGRYPKAEILGHRDISPDTNGNGKVDSWERIKECPCFDAKEEYRDLTIKN